MDHDFVAKAPLFEQLTHDSEFLKGEEKASIYLNKDQLLRSIQKELIDIFNTRSSFSNDGLDELLEEVRDESILAGIEGVLGLPNISNVFVEGGNEYQSFVDKCELMIRLYEPRLQSPTVSIESFDEQKQCLNLVITGFVKMGHLRESVTFEIAVQEGKEN